MTYWLIGLTLMVFIAFYALFYILVTILEGISLLHDDLEKIYDELIEQSKNDDRRESNQWH